MSKDTKVVVTLKSFRGHVARWAVQQSPYPQGPDGLADVLLAINDRFETNGTRLANMLYVEPLRAELYSWVESTLFAISQVQRWNRRKSGREGPEFVSAFGPSNPNPDDDFIDIWALAQNVTHSILAEDKERA